MPYCVLPLSVLQYIAVLVRLIKEHIMSLKLAKKLSRNVKLYCIFLVQSSLQCNNWIFTTWKAKNVAIYLQCAIYSSSDILYCIAVMNIAIYCNIVASLTDMTI